MEYQVPQFIEVEDKIVGPLTLKQFIYLAGGGGACVIFFVLFNIVIAVLLSIPVVALSVALAFYKVNGKTFTEMLEAGFNYYTGGKLFLWKHEEMKESAKSAAAAAAAAAEATAHAQQPATRLTRGKLSELAWSLDVNQAGNNASSNFKS